MKKIYTNTKTFFLIFLLFTLGVSAAQAQDAVSARRSMQVNGYVTNEEGDPLVGVTVLLLNTNRAVITGTSGEFSIWADAGGTLQFSYVGYETRQVGITAEHQSKPLRVKMKEAFTQIDQVIVTGYNQTSVRKSSGSVSVVTDKDLKTAPMQNIDMLLKGKMAGVNVQAVSGQPGQSAQIRIRGTSTITGNAEPLWVVDGVPLERDIPKISASNIRTGNFSTLLANGVAGINPQDIASITVLKDAAAAAIYGSRAASGVIVVTTKRGEAGRLKVNYSGFVSVSTSPQRSPDRMSSAQKLAWEQELWDEFSASGYAKSLIPEVRRQALEALTGEDYTSAKSTYYPVVGIVGMVRSGYGRFAGMSKAEQDAYLKGLSLQTTDWFDELFRTTVSHSHYLSMSGGSDRATYYVSFGYENNRGMVKHNDYSRYNFNGKVNMTPNRKLSVGVITDFSYQESNAPGSSVDYLNYAYFANPYERPYNDDGSYRADETYFSLHEINGGSEQRLPPDGFNIMREIDLNYALEKAVSTSITADLNWEIIPELRFSGVANFSITNNSSEAYNDKTTYAAWLDRPFEKDYVSDRIYSSLSESSNMNLSYMLRGSLSYGHTFGTHHRLNVTFGSEVRASNARNAFNKRYGYDPVTGNHLTPQPTWTMDDAGIIKFANLMSSLTGATEEDNAYASFYATFDYILKGRYVFNLTGRTDGSNNFGAKEQFNPTWSAGFSWNMDEEPWMKEISPAVSSFVWRVATGYRGNVNKTVYPQFVMNYSSTMRPLDNDNLRMGYIGNAPNPLLRWEKTWDMKFAADMGFVKERIHLLLEFYRSLGMDLVTNEAVPYSTGFMSQAYNNSEQVNQGIEATLSTVNIKTRDFTWDMSFNVAYNYNKLTDYRPSNGSVATGSTNYEGYPLSSVMTGKVLGIDPETGMYVFKKRSDAKGDAHTLSSYRDYLFYVGTNNAPVTGGFSMGFRYKTLSVSLSGSFSFGGIVSNEIDCPVDYSTLSGTSSGSSEWLQDVPTPRNDLYVNHLNVNGDVVRRWTKDNPITDGYPKLIDHWYPRSASDGSAKADVISEGITNAIFLEKINYVKLSSIVISYSLPEKWMKRTRLDGVNFSFTMNNLFTFTNYSGFDPETPGIVYPMTRSFSLGVGLSF